MSAASFSYRIEISAASMRVYESLIRQPMTAPFVLKALRGIQGDRYGYGRPFRGRPFGGGSLRCDVVALPGDKQLWLYWNPDLTPATVVALAVIDPHDGGTTRASG